MLRLTNMELLDLATKRVLFSKPSLAGTVVSFRECSGSWIVIDKNEFPQEKVWQSIGTDIFNFSWLGSDWDE